MFTVRVPATIANMGPGFDSFGMAVSLYNQFRFQASSSDRLWFANEDGSVHPEMGSDSILFQAMDKLYEYAGQKREFFDVQAVADIPMTRGLGSSSTAIIAGLIAANRQLENRFSNAELLKIAIEMEGHPDNVAPALLGGIVLYDTAPYSLPWPDDWRILTLSPSYPVLTEKARQILPKSVALEDSIFNLRKASVLTYALLQKDSPAFQIALQDRLHQPYRKQLIPEYDALEQVVLEAGAFGMIISGSGSTMAVFYPIAVQTTLLQSVSELLTQQHWDMTIHNLNVDMDGAVIR